MLSPSGAKVADKHVGYLVERGETFIAVCLECVEPYAPKLEICPYPALRVSNILPYRQTCGVCGRVMVEGQTPASPELFDGE